jgi:putative transposase
VLSWRLSTTLESDFCVEALQEALSRFGQPEIFNTDQGSQFTAEVFTDELLDRGIQVSMDGKGRYIDNIFVERLWRSVKYEEVYLKEYEGVGELIEALKRYFAFYNDERPHQSHGGRTPAEVYYGSAHLALAA